VLDGADGGRQPLAHLRRGHGVPWAHESMRLDIAHGHVALACPSGAIAGARRRYLVAAWLAGIIVNLLLLADHYDVALRDFGLLLAALALARLATAFRPALLRSSPA
jgi:hypothetical protein